MVLSSRHSSQRRARWLALAAVTASLPAPAAAQLLVDPPTVEIPPEPPVSDARSSFARDANVPVRERMLPAFTAQGVPLGNFRLYPGLAIGPVVTSNVFANNDRRAADIALVARPEATLRTEAGPYRFSAFGRGDLRRYAGHASENSEEGLAGAEAGLAVGDLSSLLIGGRYGSFVQPRSAADSPVDAAKPLEFRQFDAYAGGTIEGASTRLVFRADFAQLRFGDTPDRRGGTLFTRDRDRTRLGGLVRVERAISPSISVYAAGTLNRIDYRLAPAPIGDRDSWGYGAYVGSSFELTRVARGDVRVGYIRQQFKLDQADPISGLGAQAQLVFFPSRLWDIRLRAESTVQDTGVPGTLGVYRRGGAVGADYELRRYVIVGFEGGYLNDAYRGSLRTDNLYHAEVNATYLSRNHWNAQLRYRINSRSCACENLVTDFSDHRLFATLTFQY